jgi:ribosomal protein L7/L12
MNVPESWGWIGGPIALATPRIIGLFVGLALMRGADVGVWFYLGIAVLVLSLPLANPGAWLRYVRTGREASVDRQYAEEGDLRVDLQASGPRTIEVVKAVREVTGCGLVDAKRTVDTAPSTIVGGLSEVSAARVRWRLEETGATASVSEGLHS